MRPDFHYCETVCIFDDEGDWVQAYILGYPPEDISLPVEVKVLDGSQQGTVLRRDREDIHFFSLEQWMQGKRRTN